MERGIKVSSKRIPQDYKFENDELKLMPLDKKRVLSRDRWVMQNANDSKWLKFYIDDIDMYKIVGDGANGVVLKGKEQVLYRNCAIKIWLPNNKSIHYTTNQQQYIEEIRKLAKLNNKNIIQIHTAKTDKNGYCYSIMEWFKGTTLREWIEQNGGCYFEDRKDIFLEIMNTLKECHEIQVYHGDLHTNNIMISDDINIKILDFGTSFFSKKKNPNKTKERESAFLLKLAYDLMPEIKEYDFLEFKFYGVNNPISNTDDVRNYSPELVRETLKSLCIIVYLLEIDAHTQEALIDMATAVADAPYLLIDNILQYIYAKYGESDLIFLNYNLQGSIERKIVNDIEEDYSKLYYSLELYYSFLQDNEYNLNNTTINNNINNKFVKNIFDLSVDTLKKSNINLKEHIEPIYKSMNSEYFGEFLDFYRPFLYNNILKFGYEKQYIEAQLFYKILNKKYELQYADVRRNDISDIIDKHNREPEKDGIGLEYDDYSSEIRKIHFDIANNPFKHGYY